jgi:hypothetical protein
LLFGDVLQLSGKQSSKARGVSGNPGGRPKSNELVVALAQDCTEEAISTLGEIMRD